MDGVQVGGKGIGEMSGQSMGEDLCPSLLEPFLENID